MFLLQVLRKDAEASSGAEAGGHASPTVTGRATTPSARQVPYGSQSPVQVSFILLGRSQGVLTARARAQCDAGLTVLQWAGRPRAPRGQSETGSQVGPVVKTRDNL